MITAIEAKRLSDVGGKVIENILSNLDGCIKDEAMKGNRQYKCYNHVKWESHEQQYREPVATPVQAAVMVKLKELGFEAKMCWDGDKYVPRGLADENGDGPLHQNYVLVISW